MTTGAGAGVFGVMVNGDGAAPAALLASARRIEELGYQSVWINENLGRDVYVTAGYLLANTTRLKVGSGVAQIYGRDATATAKAARTLADLYDDRFILGMGVSTRQLAEARGHSWLPPTIMAADYVQAVREAPLLQAPVAERRVQVHLAAHSPKMLAGPAQVADGVLSYMQTPQSIAEIRSAIGPQKSLTLITHCCLTTDPDMARRRGRQALSVYLGLPAYHRLWAREGFEPDDWTGKGSDRLVDAYLSWGDLDQVTARIKELLGAGVTNLVINSWPNRQGDPDSTWELIEKLAPHESNG